MNKRAPHYMSPEHALGDMMDHRSVLYSLGATFFQMLTGRTVFVGKNIKSVIRKHLNEDPVRVDALCPEIPKSVSEIVAKLLEKDPGNRFQTASELKDCLNNIKDKELRSGNIVRVSPAAGISARRPKLNPF